MIKSLFLVLIILLLTGCSAAGNLGISINMIGQTAIPDTETPIPSSTSTPTQTTTFTPTITATSTSTPTATATPTFTPTNTRVKPPTQVPGNTSGSGPCGVTTNSGLEAELIALINQERNNNGISSLAVSGSLTNTSRNHSLDMACNNYASHIDSTGATSNSRLQAAGFTTLYGENIAGGYASAADVFSGWMNSSEHKANILNPGLSYIGVGYAFKAETTYGSYWTADFGTP